MDVTLTSLRISMGVSAHGYIIDSKFMVLVSLS